jgi:CubicO group peptidase (beta-lactamase class C family)
LKGYTITIGHLLSQTSGIRNYFEQETDAKAEGINNYSPKQVIDIFKKEALQFIPGTTFQYSNSNYFILGYIIEKVSGLSYKDYVEQLIKKAGLKYTFYIGPQRVSPYSRFDWKMEDAELQSVNLNYGAGALESTANDLLKWHQALYSGKLIGLDFEAGYYSLQTCRRQRLGIRVGLVHQKTGWAAHRGA